MRDNHHILRSLQETHLSRGKDTEQGKEATSHDNASELRMQWVNEVSEPKVVQPDDSIKRNKNNVVAASLITGILVNPQRIVLPPD